MNGQLKQQRDIQSFFDPALRILCELHNRNRANLRSKNYDENNAAITKEELSQVMSQRFRITLYLAQQIVNSLVSSNTVISFGGYVKPQNSESYL